MSLKLDADYYRQNSLLQKTLAAELLAKYHFNAADQVLDIGCGEGFITDQIAGQLTSGAIKGIDPSQDMIDLANNLYSKRSNLSFAFGYAEDAHGHEQYDVIASFNCLYWVKDINTAMQHIYDALKPGGRLIALIYPGHTEYSRLLKETLNLPKWRRYDDSDGSAYWMTTPDWLALAEKVGFKVSECDLTDQVADYATDDAYKAYVQGWIPCLFTAEEALYAAFLDDLALQAARCADQQGHLKIPYKKLHLCLSK